MPHTSHKKRPGHQKRREVVDENGWTRVTSHQCQSRPQPPMPPSIDHHGPRFDPLHIPDGMTEEQVIKRYHVIEKKWQASQSCKRLAMLLHEALRTNPILIDNCVCFGTGSMSGVSSSGIGRHDTALYQIAAFKNAIDTIEEVQSRRPAAYAQEPRYNTLDTNFLKKLQITKVDSPSGWELIASSKRPSFTYLPGAEHFVSVLTLKQNPMLYLGAELSWLREHQAEGASPLPPQNHSPTKKDQQAILQAIDNYMAEHNVQKLPDLDAADHPFYEQVLYWQKPADT